MPSTVLNSLCILPKVKYTISDLQKRKLRFGELENTQVVSGKSPISDPDLSDSKVLHLTIKLLSDSAGRSRRVLKGL